MLPVGSTTPPGVRWSRERLGRGGCALSGAPSSSTADAFAKPYISRR